MCALLSRVHGAIWSKETNKEFILRIILNEKNIDQRQKQHTIFQKNSYYSWKKKRKKKTVKSKTNGESSVYGKNIQADHDDEMIQQNFTFKMIYIQYTLIK